MQVSRQSWIAQEGREEDKVAAILSGMHLAYKLSLPSK